MRILDRYLIKSFIAPFFVCTGIFSVLVMLGRYFERMEVFTQFNASSSDIIRYLFYSMPFWLNLVLPIATMLALLFSLGTLQQRGELTACRSAGISSFRLYAPFFAIGLLLSVVSFVGGYTFLPKFNFIARSIYRVEIKQGQALSYRRDHVVVAGRNHRRFTIGWLDVEKGIMTDVVTDRFGDNLEWLETVSAKTAEYRGGQWYFQNGHVRRYDPAKPGSFLEEAFVEKAMDIPERPGDFIVEDKPPDDMTGREIVRRIERLQRLGAPSARERVALQLKASLPFANIIVIALAIPFAVKSGMRGSQGRTQTFAYALSLAFLYWGLTSVCQSFGEHGRMPPWLAAWTSNFLFGGLAIWRLRQTAL
jgi:lipopolysaccharide export system permease protein